VSKPILQLAALGVAGFALWKLGSFFLLPLIFFALKIAFLVAIVLFAIWFFKRNDKPSDSSDAERPGSQST
jgi:membrane protein implicated in regulation of membrane protease activity